MTIWLRILLVAVLAMMLPAGLANAQQIGIAVSQAPEAGTGICFGDNADTALSCARQACMDETGFEAEYCPRTLWCFPAGWSVDIFMQHKEGLHWHDFSCGWQDREQVEAAVALKCDSEWLRDCTAVRIWTPEGEEVLQGD